MSSGVTLRNINACFPLEIEQEEHKAVAQPLIEAEKLFEKLSSYCLSLQEELKLKGKLSLAYRELQNLAKVEKENCIPIGLASVAARIFYLYGLIVLGEDPRNAEAMYHKAMACQLVAQKILLSETQLPFLKAKSLTAPLLRLDNETEAVFTTVDACLKDSDGFADKVLSLSDKEAYHTATMVRSFITSYLDKKTYQKTYSIAKKIFSELANRTSSADIKEGATRALFDLERRTMLKHKVEILTDRTNKQVLQQRKKELDQYLFGGVGGAMTKGQLSKMFAEKELLEKKLKAIEECEQSNNASQEEITEGVQNLIQQLENNESLWAKQQLVQIDHDFYTRTPENLNRLIAIADTTPGFDPFLKNQLIVDLVIYSSARNYLPLSKEEAYEKMQGVIAFCNSQEKNHEAFFLWYIVAATCAEKLEDKQKLIDLAKEVDKKFSPSIDPKDRYFLEEINRNNLELLAWQQAVLDRIREILQQPETIEPEISSSSDENHATSESSVSGDPLFRRPPVPVPNDDEPSEFSLNDKIPAQSSWCPFL
jgi:hypothetical protein